MCGGTGAAKEATDDIQTICDLLKAEIGQKVGKDNFSVFKALQYKSQLVAGSNYFVKIQVAESGDCIHVRIFEPLPCNNDTNQRVFLHGVQDGKSTDDALEYFDKA